MEGEFEAALKFVRETYMKQGALRARADKYFSRSKMSHKDAELQYLKIEVQRKDGESREMQNRLAQAESRCAQIETQLALAEKKIMEMGSSMSKLSNFKQSVIQSLEGVREFASSVDGRSRSVSANAMAQAAHHAIMAANNEPNYPEVHVEQYRATQVPQFSSQPVISINMSPLDNMVVRETSMNAASRQQVSNNGKYQPYVAPSMSTLNQSIPIASQMQQQQQQQEQQQLNVQHQQQHARSRATSSTSRQTQNGMHSYSSQPASPQPVPPPQAPGSATSTSISASPRLAAKSGTQAVDGRDFFKQARSVLNYDEFTSLLHNVKMYNSREQTRVKTLDHLQALLLDKHEGLYEQFEQLVMGGR